MALTPIAKRLAVELTLPDLTTLGLSRPRFEHPTFCMQDLLSNQLPRPSLGKQRPGHIHLYMYI